MYTVVFKQKIGNLVVFDVFKSSLLGKQRVIGNIFCSKNNSEEYEATSSFYMASKPQTIRWDGGKKSYYLEEIALWICNKMIEKCE